MPESASYTSEQIYQILHDEILNLDLLPGQPLLEHEVGRRFGVSRTPVRTAFFRLKDEGLLRVVPYKGSYVTLLDFDNVLQLIYMRVAIETMVMRDYARLGDPLELERLRYHIRRQGVLIQDPQVEPAEFYASDAAIHKLFYQATHKEILWDFIQRAQIHYTRFRMLDMVKTPSYEELYRDHQELFRIVEERRFDQIEPCVRRHIYSGLMRLQGHLETEFAPYFVQQVFHYPTPEEMGQIEIEGVSQR